MLRKSFLYILSILFPFSALANEPKPWQLDLQEPAGIIAEMATDLHNFLLIVITLISLFVYLELFPNDKKLLVTLIVLKLCNVFH